MAMSFLRFRRKFVGGVAQPEQPEIVLIQRLPVVVGSNPPSPGGILFASNFTAAAAENAGWMTAQTESIFSRTFVSGGGPTGGGAYDFVAVTSHAGENYYGWSDRTVSVATAGQTRYYRISIRWPSGNSWSGLQRTKLIFPHDSQNGNNERAICEMDITTSALDIHFQHDGGVNKIAHLASMQFDTWFHIQWEIRYSSGVNVADGSWKVWINNNTQASPTLSQTMIQNTATGPNANLMRTGYQNTNYTGPYAFRIGRYEVGTAFDGSWSI